MYLYIYYFFAVFNIVVSVFSIVPVLLIQRLVNSSQAYDQT